MKFKNQKEMFDYVWDSRPHISELSNRPLLPRNHFKWHWQFLHVLPKGSYPKYKLNPENILLALPDEHDRQEQFEVFVEKREELKREYLWQDDLEEERKQWFLKLIDLLKERCHTIKEFPVRAKPFLSDDLYYNSEGVEKHLKDERLEKLLPKLKDDFSHMEDFSSSQIEQVLRQRAEKEGVKAALLIHALRILVVGEPVSPGIFDVLELVGKEKTIERMNEDKQTIVRIELIIHVLSFSLGKNRINPVPNPNAEIPASNPIADIIAITSPISAEVYNLATIIHNTNPIAASKTDFPINQ